MVHREKLAWLTLACMMVAYGIYFPMIASIAAARDPGLFEILWLFGIVAGTQALVVIAGTVVLALLSRGEARAPADERDRAIARRGANMAYYVLLVGAILVGVVMPFSEPAWKIVNTMLLAIVIAEAIRLAVVLLSYRRGWHG